MPVNTVTPLEAKRLLADGALLVDIRETPERAREHIPGSVHVPLTRIGTLQNDSRSVVFHCRSGMRTGANAATLAAAANGAPCYLLAGGLDAWRGASLPTTLDRTQPIDIMRQVQIIAGGLVALGVLLGFLVAPAFTLLSAFVGCGLMLAGATGWCGMARLLQLMPWNRRALQG